MLQLDNNNTQRGAPAARGSDFNNNPSSSIFPTPTATLTNGNGIPIPPSSSTITHPAPSFIGPHFMGLSSGQPPPGSLPAAMPTQAPGAPAVGSMGSVGGALSSMIHWGTGSPQHLNLALQPTGPPPTQQSGSGIGLLCNGGIDNNNGNNSEDEDDDDYRPFTPPPPRERLSYTRYQLELLNGIYNEVRYPNSTQKQLIAKRVGITREQVKIWFQNRRRKDVVSKGGKPDGKDSETPNMAAGDSNSNPDISDPNSNSSSSTKQHDDGEATDPAGLMKELSESGSTENGSTQNEMVNGRISAGSQAQEDNEDSSDSKDKMVSIVVLNSIVAELQKFNNEYLKQKKNKKKSKSKSAKHAASLAAAAAAASNISAASCKSKRLFQSYDMIAPPNKVTPSAFLNTSANRFKHARGTSAFQNPRENRLMPIPPLNLGDNRLWDGFGLSHGSSFPSTAEPADLLQQRSPADPSSAIPSSLAPSFGIQNQSAHQHAFGELLSGSMAAVHNHLNSQNSLYDNLPVLSDLLSSYKNQQSASAVAAAAVAHRQQLEQSLLSSSGSPGRPPPPTQPFFHFPGGGNPRTGSLSSSGSGSSSSINTNNSNNTGEDSSKSPLSDLTFPSPTAPPPTNPFPFPSHHYHNPHSSPFGLNRVFPFPLIADPPVMLSSIRQSDSTFRTHPPHQWPHPPSSLSQSTPPGLPPSFGGSGTASQISPSSNEDPYRPLLISSLNNPYFSPTSSNNYSPFSSSTLPPPPQHNWSTSPPGTDSTDFAPI